MATVLKKGLETIEFIFWKIPWSDSIMKISNFIRSNCYKLFSKNFMLTKKTVRFRANEFFSRCDVLNHIQKYCIHIKTPCIALKTGKKLQVSNSKDTFCGNNVSEHFKIPVEMEWASNCSNLPTVSQMKHSWCI